jgi:hypothetical protein
MRRQRDQKKRNEKVTKLGERWTNVALLKTVEKMVDLNFLAVKIAIGIKCRKSIVNLSGNVTNVLFLLCRLAPAEALAAIWPRS